VVRVNDDEVGNGRDQFFPWFDVDPVTGTIDVVFYDRRYTTGWDTDVSLAVSTDGGDHFNNQPISASSFLPDPGVFFGDYIGVSALGGRVRPLWMRLDSNVLSLWTALIDPLPTDTVVTWFQGDGLRVTPNPARGEVNILWGNRAELPSDLQVMDVQGRLVRDLPVAPGITFSRRLQWDARDAGGRPAGAGVYFLRGNGRKLGRMVLLP
jgi:hypothetical protein